MSEWPVDREVDEKLRRLVEAEVAAADARQIRPRTRSAGRSGWAGAGVALVVVVVLVATLVWRSQATPAMGGPSETPSAEATVLASEQPSETANESPNESPSGSPTAVPVAGTPGPTADPAIRAGKKMTCIRYRQAAVTLADGRVLIAGGCMNADGSSTPAFGTAEIYDPSMGLFTPTGAMTVERFWEATALLDDGRVFFYGGEMTSGTTAGTSSSAEAYDPTSGRFVPLGYGLAERGAGSAVALDDGRVLILEGGGAQPTTAELYAPATGSFKAAGPMAVRGDGPAVGLKDGRVLSLGLTDGVSDAGRVAQIYDPSTNAFTQTGSPLVQADGLSCLVSLADGRALYLPDDNDGTTEIYDPANGFFANGASLPKPMTPMGCVTLTDGRVLVLGTVNAEPQPQYGLRPSVGAGMLFDRRPAPSGTRAPSYITGPFNITGELYDPTTNHWTVLGHLNVQRSNFSVVALQDGRALIVGGASDTAELFDPKTGKFALNG